MWLVKIWRKCNETHSPEGLGELLLFGMTQATENDSPHISLKHSLKNLFEIAETQTRIGERTPNHWLTLQTARTRPGLKLGAGSPT